MRWSRVAPFMVVAAGAATGCGGKTDELAKVTDCLRDHHARVVAEPAVMSKLADRQGWKIRLFALGRNRLSLVSTSSAAEARKARERLARAIVAVDSSRPPARRSGRLAYWWAESPSLADRAVLRRCLRR